MIDKNAQYLVLALQLPLFALEKPFASHTFPLHGERDVWDTNSQRKIGLYGGKNKSLGFSKIKLFMNNLFITSSELLRKTL